MEIIFTFLYSIQLQVIKRSDILIKGKAQGWIRVENCLAMVSWTHVCFISALLCIHRNSFPHGHKVAADVPSILSMSDKDKVRLFFTFTFISWRNST